nr:DUF4129 domain-containing protein [Haloferula luteola]
MESVTAELRPRSDWEAVDLGLALVRRDFWRLLLSWWLGMAPMVMVAGVTFWWSPVLAFLGFWWWVPVGSRMVLFQLSRRLFGDAPKLTEELRELPRAMGRRWGYRLGWARFSPWRPLTMPVEDLEGLRGRDYRTRCRTLMRRGDSSLVQLHLWRIGLTGWLVVSGISTLYLFLPVTAKAEWATALETGQLTPAQGMPMGLAVAWGVCLTFAVALTDLFATGAGFGIYVNHRTWIEGWDVELSFRRIAARLARVAIWMMAVCLGCGMVRGDDGAKDRMGEVLSDPDFEVHHEVTRKWVPWDWLERWLSRRPMTTSSGGTGWMDVMAVLGNVALVSLAVLAVVFLSWLIYSHRHVFLNRRMEANPSAPKLGASVVMGMDVRESSLPDDVAKAAWAAWLGGRRQEALALLYRGAISWMIRVPGVEIAESDTEMDCLRRVHDAGVVEAGYFEDLTQVWSRLAYARREPEDRVVEGLCHRWPFGTARSQEKGGTA